MPEFRDNVAQRRYERETPEGVCFAAYREVGATRVLLHVETPLAARGKGHAARLMDDIVAHARANALALAPHCSYAVSYFRRQPAAGDVLA